MAINVINRFPSVPNLQGAGLKENRPVNSEKDVNVSSLSFESILKSKTSSENNLKISKHANERLTQRNIDLSSEQWARLSEGVRKAEEKGIKESLIMVDDVAFIVNVNNSTVITAVDDNEDKVFTNIDGAVIV